MTRKFEYDALNVVDPSAARWRWPPVKVGIAAGFHFTGCRDVPVEIDSSVEILIEFWVKAKYLNSFLLIFH